MCACAYAKWMNTANRIAESIAQGALHDASTSAPSELDTGTQVRAGRAPAGATAHRRALELSLPLPPLVDPIAGDGMRSLSAVGPGLNRHGMAQLGQLVAKRNRVRDMRVQLRQRRILQSSNKVSSMAEIQLSTLTSCFCCLPSCRMKATSSSRRSFLVRSAAADSNTETKALK